MTTLTEMILTVLDLIFLSYPFFYFMVRWGADQKSYVLASLGKVDDVLHRVTELEKQIEVST